MKPLHKEQLQTMLFISYRPCCLTIQVLLKVGSSFQMYVYHFPHCILTLTASVVVLSVRRHTRTYVCLRIIFGG